MTPSPPERTAPSAASPLRSGCLVALLMGLALGASRPAELQAAGADSLTARSPQTRPDSADSLAVPAPEAASDTLRQSNENPLRPQSYFVKIWKDRMRRAHESWGLFIASQGVENVTLDSSYKDIAYENRRFRHSAPSARCTWTAPFANGSSA